MFNSSAKREAIEKLKAAVERHETVRKDVERASVRLFEQRMYAANVIELVEDYLSRLNNSPREFYRAGVEFRIEVNRFKDKVGRSTDSDNETDEAEEVTIPFAVKWLGLAIGGTGLIGSGIFLNRRNKKAAEEATRRRLQIEELIGQLQTVCREIEGLEARTRDHVAGCLAELDWLISYDPKKYRRFRWLGSSMVEELARHDPYDYQQFDQEQKERLAALIDHVRSLSELLKAEVTL